MEFATVAAKIVREIPGSCLHVVAYVRVGSLFAFEMLCVMLGRLFEPYVVHLLPHLLLCFGDNNQYVREVSTLSH